MKKNNYSGHIFSFYYKLIQRKYIVYTDNLFFRLKNILRTKVGDRYILFDKFFWHEIVIIEINKKKISYSIIESHKIIYTQKTELIAYIPILHSKYLNQALYLLGKTFISKIYLVKTELSKQKTSLSFEKLNQYIIQGAEESKNYCFPTLVNKIITIPELLLSNKKILLLYEKATINIQEYTKSLYTEEVTENNTINFLCGPEEGFTEKELSGLLSAKNIYSYSLHNVILKSIDTIFYISILLSQKNT